jgi:universal stress protein A
MNDSLVPVMQIDEQIHVKRARTQIETLARELGTAGRRLQRRSRAAPRAKSCATRARSHSDLIVLGCRERHGLSILMHHTEDSVLHGSALRRAGGAGALIPFPPSRAMSE